MLWSSPHSLKLLPCFRMYKMDIKSLDDTVDFQTDYLLDLEKILNIDTKIDRRDIFHRWWQTYRDDPMNYRDYAFRSYITGKEAAPPIEGFMKCDNINTYLEIMNKQHVKDTKRNISLN